MASTAAPVPDEGMSVIGVPKYMNYVYEWNWLTVLFFIYVSYTVPCIYVFLKIAFFNLKYRSTIRKSGLREEIFQAFILMQLFGILFIICEFLLFRIPITGIVTSFCATQNPQFLMRIISFILYVTCYSSQLLTVLFCGLRVAILYSVRQRITKLAVFIIPFIILTATFIVAYPHFSSNGVCIQMFGNFPFGSILVISIFSYVDVKTVQIEDMLIITFTCLSIIVLTALTLRKIRKTRFLNNQRSAVQGATIEKTLTRTMIILLIPLLVHFLNAAAVLFQVFSIFPSLVSHALLLRPWFLDLRVHAATVYFYRTHPIFKSHKKLVNVSSSQNVRV